MRSIGSSVSCWGALTELYIYRKQKKTPALLSLCFCLPAPYFHTVFLGFAYCRCYLWTPPSSLCEVFIRWESVSKKDKNVKRQPDNIWFTREKCQFLTGSRRSSRKYTQLENKSIIAYVVWNPWMTNLTLSPEMEDHQPFLSECADIFH